MTDQTICFAPDCGQPPVMSWQRWATPQEIQDFHESGDLPQSELSAKMLVVGCGPHTVSNPHLTHEASCSAPDVPCCPAGEEEIADGEGTP